LGKVNQCGSPAVRNPRGDKSPRDLTAIRYGALKGGNLNKVKIKVITIGHLPITFNKRIIEKWDSKIFELSGDIENFVLSANSDGAHWEYSDSNLRSELPKKYDGDILFAIVNVPVENNYYVRRLANNTVILTFHEIRNILEYHNIPLENVVLRILYALTIIYNRFNKKVPSTDENSNYTHDETRGCLFDMTGIKEEIIYSCHRPILCESCLSQIKKDKVSNETICLAVEEIKRIKKKLFYRIADVIKNHPIWAIIISSLFAILLGVIGSLIASFLFEIFKRALTSGLS
jgi:hypothetical protein